MKLFIVDSMLSTPYLHITFCFIHVSNFIYLRTGRETKMMPYIYIYIKICKIIVFNLYFPHYTIKILITSNLFTYSIFAVCLYLKIHKHSYEFLRIHYMQRLPFTMYQCVSSNNCFQSYQVMN